MQKSVTIPLDMLIFSSAPTVVAMLVDGHQYRDSKECAYRRDTNYADLFETI